MQMEWATAAYLRITKHVASKGRQNIASGAIVSRNKLRHKIVFEACSPIGPRAFRTSVTVFL
jgi:hypothetical protein